MRNQRILFLTLILAACGQSNPKADIYKESDEAVKENISTVDTSGTFSITSATYEDYSIAKTSYRDKLIPDTNVIHKKDGVIKLPLQRPHYPPSVIFTDSLIDEGDEYEREYHYLGQYPDLRLYLVFGSFWEHYEYYLIDKTTGYITVLWNEPKLSPSSGYLANLSMPFGMDGIPNGFQIWETDSTGRGAVNKLVELDQQLWVPIDLVWESEHSILLKVYSLEAFWDTNGEINEKDYYYLRVRF